METMTPGQLLIILSMAVVAVLARLAYDARAAWLPWAMALWDRWFAVRLPDSPDALADRDRLYPGGPYRAPVSINMESARGTYVEDLQEVVDGRGSVPVSAPEPRSQAVPGPSERGAPESAEPLRLSKADVIRALATLEILDSAGNAKLVEVKAIARFVGMRDQEVSAIVREVRGSPSPDPPAKGDPRFPELTADGRGVAAHLRTKARA